MRKFSLWLLLLGGLLAPVSVAPAQVRIPDDALVATAASVDQALAEGRQLEQERRWGEALSLYERLLRDYPDQPALQQRRTLARIHFDLARRYADSSYLQSLRRMPGSEALDLYSEVLLKIQTHYVQSPDWRVLVGRGRANLEAALDDPLFVSHNIPQERHAAIGETRVQLTRLIQSSPVADRHAARYTADQTANLLYRQLGVPPQAAILEFVCGAASALDDYSGFLTSGQLDDVYSQIEGNFVGLGIELKADEGALLLVHVIPGGPAAEAGIQAGHRILEVDGQTMQDVTTDQAADLLKGPDQSYVEVLLETPSGDRRLRLQRRHVEVPSVENVEIVDAEYGVAYLKLTSFQKTTSRDVDQALWNLHRQGMRSLIVDVRGNPGGLLTSAVEVADKFLQHGLIVSTRGRNLREDHDYRAEAIGTWRVPLTVLIDGDSASASEIFAAAIRDNRRGTIVGETSYGKGSVQGIFPLNEYPSGLRLTTARFYSPNGQPISKRGVSPDVRVETVARPTAEGQLLSDVQDDARDAVLAAAIRTARGQ